LLATSGFGSARGLGHLPRDGLPRSRLGTERWLNGPMIGQTFTVPGP
jgi:hypothetical protein